MELAPYLTFKGDCREAFELYARCFGGRVEMIMTYGESPMRDQFASEWHDKVMHTRLVAGNYALMGCDAPPERYTAAQGTHVSVSVPTRADGERTFNALAEGGRVTMPFEKTFWASGFGMLVDRFGIPWMVGAEEQA